MAKILMSCSDARRRNSAKSKLRDWNEDVTLEHGQRSIYGSGLIASHPDLTVAFAKQIVGSSAHKFEELEEEQVE